MPRLRAGPSVEVADGVVEIVSAVTSDGSWGRSSCPRATGYEWVWLANA